MARKADRDLVCGNHHGQRPKRRANRSNTRLHPTTPPNVTSALAMREPSTQDLPDVRWRVENGRRLLNTTLAVSLAGIAAAAIHALQARAGSLGLD